MLEEDGKLELQVISPRCFEAACLGTVMIMYPGNYSGILKPGVHYISLEKDFSNIEQVLLALKDMSFLESMALKARSDLIDSGKFSFRNFITEFDDSLVLIAKRKKWKVVGECTDLATHSSFASSDTNKDTSRHGNALRKLVRAIWMNSPAWVRFLFMVTILRRNYYAHLYRLKDRYRT